MKFDEATQRVHVTCGDRSFSLQQDVPFAYVGEEQEPLTKAPKLMNGAVTHM